MTSITSAKLVEFLGKRKFERLGGGLYSDVFAPVGSARVVKISKGYNDSWPDYIIWATKQGYAGSLSPKVYSIHFTDSGYVATMERLISINSDDPLAFSGYTQFEQLSRWRDLRHGECPNPKLNALIEGVRSTFGDLDYHSGNFMCRADGTLVLTDPVRKCDYSENLPKRMRARDIAWTRNAQFANQKVYAKSA